MVQFRNMPEPCRRYCRRQCYIVVVFAVVTVVELAFTFVMGACSRHRHQHRKGGRV